MAAYGEGPVQDADRYVLWQAEVAEVLPAGWFYDRLAERLARRANDAALLARVQEQAAVRVDRQFARSNRLTLVELGAMAVGTVAGRSGPRRAGRAKRSSAKCCRFAMSGWRRCIVI